MILKVEGLQPAEMMKTLNLQGRKCMATVEALYIHYPTD